MNDAIESLSAVDDAELVRRFVEASDELAFAEIVSRHGAMVHAVSASQLHNFADAEEIAQDTFVRAHRGLHNFRGDSSLKTWLHRIVLNLSRNRYWWYARRGRAVTLSLDCPLESTEGDTTIAGLIADGAPSPAREVALVEMTQLVTECSEKLGRRHREILALRNGLNHSYNQIAAELGISSGTVKSRIARARSALRTLMAQRCLEFKDQERMIEWLESDHEAALMRH